MHRSWHAMPAVKVILDVSDAAGTSPVSKNTLRDYFAGHIIFMQTEWLGSRRRSYFSAGGEPYNVVIYSRFSEENRLYIYVVRIISSAR